MSEQIDALNAFAAAYAEDPGPGCVREGIQQVIDQTGGAEVWGRMRVEGELGCRACLHSVMCVDGGRPYSTNNIMHCPDMLQPSGQPF